MTSHVHSFQVAARLDGDIEGTMVTAHAVRAEEDEEDNEYYEFDKKCIGLTSLILIGLMVMCVCISESFHYVKYNEYGLLQDVYGDVRLSKVYGEGRYFYPLNYNMLKFPSTFTAVDFDAVVFSETGLEFTVEIGFYYRIPRDNLGTIYNSFSKNYHDRVVSNSQTVIKNTAAPVSCLSGSVCVS